MKVEQELIRLNVAEKKIVTAAYQKAQEKVRNTFLKTILLRACGRILNTK